MTAFTYPLTPVLAHPDGWWINQPRDQGNPATKPAAAADSGAIFRLPLDDQKKEEALLLRSQRVDAIGALANGIAHDLNNALAPVLMATELLISRCVDPVEQRLLEVIRIGAQRGADMVKQILVFARGGASDRGIVQLKHLVREVVDLAHETFPPEIVVLSEIPNDIWAVIGNPTQFHQVVLNLCVNARDAMPAGGRLTINAVNVRLGEQTATPFPDAKAGPFVVLTVSDTGCGMTPEVRRQIFDPFFTTKAADKGTGLGLATVHGIVRSHGGFLSVESQEGVGSEFKVWLPALPTAVLPTTSARAGPPLGNGEWVLVVDDEAAIRSIASQILELSGYHVMPAEDGAHAVALCAQHRDKLRVMITDMAMPVMDGPTAIRAIRSLAPQLRIIAASGMDEASRAIAEAQTGVHAFLQKPYGADELLRTVHAVLQSGAVANQPVFGDAASGAE